MISALLSARDSNSGTNPSASASSYSSPAISHMATKSEAPNSAAIGSAGKASSETLASIPSTSSDSSTGGPAQAGQSHGSVSATRLTGAGRPPDLLRFLDFRPRLTGLIAASMPSPLIS
jgi:hypothetical protein